MMATEPAALTVRLDPEMLKKIDKFRTDFAKKNQGAKLSASAVVRMALQDFMEKQ